VGSAARGALQAVSCRTTRARHAQAALAAGCSGADEKIENTKQVRMWKEAVWTSRNDDDLTHDSWKIGPPTSKNWSAELPLYWRAL
jgi:hypothetical protein